MKQVFDYLENADFSATVCNNEGKVVYQNVQSRHSDGDVLGQNLYNCHGKKSGEKIKHMIATGENNTYAIVKQGKHYLIRHSPWYEAEGGKVAGLIELSIPLPDEYPTFNRDKE